MFSSLTSSWEARIESKVCGCDLKLLVVDEKGNHKFEVLIVDSRKFFLQRLGNESSKV